MEKCKKLWQSLKGRVKQVSQAHIFVVVVVFAFGCSQAQNTQYTNKVDAPLFVSELYGSASQIIPVSHGENSHISWMGLVHSNDYQYFKILKIESAGTVIAEDGGLYAGQSYTANENAIFNDISVNASQGEGVVFDASTSTYENTTANDLKITVAYNPLVPIEDEAKPHEAYLLVNYDTPQSGTLRIKLQGYTRGIKSDKCNQAASTMTAMHYEVVNDAFDLYFCSAQVSRYDQSNTPSDPADPNYHGANTNVASVPYDNVITLYKADDETVCLLTSPEPSLPTFDLPVPEIGSVPVDELSDIHMTDGSYAECSLDADGNLLCDNNIQISAIVSLSSFSMTNQTFDAELLKTSDCSDFGSFSGSGSLYDTGSNISLVMYGTAISDTNTEAYQIVDALIGAKFELQRID